MTLFLSTDALRQRKRDLQDPAVIGGLAASLQRELHAALDVPVPHGKSRLTRNGGRCATCTVLLTFDPRSPYAHTCPTCGAVYADQVHHEWWLMNGHLWTAEQCTRAAAIVVSLVTTMHTGGLAENVIQELIVAPAMLSFVEGLTHNVANNYVDHRKAEFKAQLLTDTRIMVDEVYRPTMQTLADRAIHEAGFIDRDAEALRSLPQRIEVLLQVITA